MTSPLKNILNFVEPLTLDKKISLTDLIKIFRGQGHFCVFFIVSLLFSTPIQIPGLSTPFGLFMAFIAFRAILGKKVYLFRFTKDKFISSERLSKILKIASKIETFLSKWSNPRISILTSGFLPLFFQNFIVAICSLFLSLPLPIPLSNMFFSWIILIVSIGHLMNDGLILLTAYILFSLCLSSALYIVI